MAHEAAYVLGGAYYAEINAKKAAALEGRLKLACGLLGRCDADKALRLEVREFLARMRAEGLID